MIRKLKKSLACLIHLPLHPQWFCAAGGTRIKKILQESISEGIVVDIGCAGMWPDKFIDARCTYIGLDYPETAEQWYRTVPTVFGDAHQLPFKEGTVDHVLLLDVIEHLQDTEKVFLEIRRVLKDRGQVVLQVPFIYPIHDAPRDFYRWTTHGLLEIAANHNFSVVRHDFTGHPVETAAMLSNIAMAKAVLNFLKNKNPAFLLVIFLPFYILMNNLVSWVIAKFSCEDDFMPLNYQLILRKNRL